MLGGGNRGEEGNRLEGELGTARGDVGSCDKKDVSDGARSVTPLCSPVGVDAPELEGKGG